MKAPAVVLTNPKYPHNVAAAIRACACFAIDSLIWTGNRVDPEKYERLPREERLKGYRSVEWVRHDKPFNLLLTGVPVCVEIHPNSTSLADFEHPQEAIYVFGPEDGGVSQMMRRFCHHFVHIPSRHCLNLAAALNVVLYDRVVKLRTEFSVADTEQRGEIAIAGWDGK